MNSSSLPGGASSSSSSKSYNTLVDFAKFLRENGHKLFEKDTKLCLKSEQLIVLNDYLQQIASFTSANGGGGAASSSGAGDPSDSSKFNSKRKNSQFYSKEFLQLYKSNQLHLIQDFLFKITNLKISTEGAFNLAKDSLKLNIFGSLTYLELKNCPITNVHDLQNLRNQLEVLICNKCITRIQDLLHLCGADQSSPLSWPKLHTLNLSYNQISSLDNSLRLASSIENLDLSHNNIKDCANFLQSLGRLKKLNMSFNKLESIPLFCSLDKKCSIEYLDLSFNSIDTLKAEYLETMESLNFLNISDNLISDLNQIGNLRFTPNIKQILIDRNPVKHNDRCAFVIKQIVSSSEIRNKMKTTSPKSQSGSLRYSFSPSHHAQRQTGLADLGSDGYSSTSPSQKDQMRSRLNVLGAGAGKTKGFTAKLRMSGTGSVATGSGPKRKLKANNILIDTHEDPQFDDYVVIGRRPDEDAADKSSTNRSEKDLALDQQPLTALLPSVSILSTSYDPEYDPSNLQKELDNLKKMRQNYGTDWLLSAPSFVSTNMKKSSSFQRGDQLANKSAEAKQAAELAGKFNLDDQYLNETIESFAVYKIQDIGQASFDKDDKKLCILSLNDKLLVERDETNEIVLNVKELADLSEVSPAGVSSEITIRINFKSSISNTVYEFENKQELDSFVKCLSKLLFNAINLPKCELYFCAWCNEFNKKSKFKIVDDDDEHDVGSMLSEQSENNTDHLADLACTKCNHYLIKNNMIQAKDGGVESGIQITIDEADDEDQSRGVDVGRQLKRLTLKTQSSSTLKRATSSTMSNNSANMLSTSMGERKASGNLASSFTLRDVLKSMKPAEEEASSQAAGKDVVWRTEFDAERSSLSPPESDTTAHEVAQTWLQSANSGANSRRSSASSSTNDNQSRRKSRTPSPQNVEQNENQLLQSLLSNNQITKSKLDEISSQSKRINNNLKLYLIINILHNEEELSGGGGSSDKQESNAAKQIAEDEQLVSTFKIKLFYQCCTYGAAAASTNQKAPSTSTTSDLKSVENFLCVLTNRNITMLKITNMQSFSQNIDFDKSLKREFSIDINRIESIEVGLGQHYLQIQYVSSPNQQQQGGKSKAAADPTGLELKFVTFDIYQTQTFLSILMKLINESKNASMLKQIKKFNKQTNQNLIDQVIAKLDYSSNTSSIDVNQLPITLFTFIHDLAMNETPGGSDSNQEQITKELFLYNNERLVLLEEQMSYFHSSQDGSPDAQFKLIDHAKISDIVHMKLFREQETKIEISFVDESKNSKQITWSFGLNKQFMLSQLIAQLKKIWEEIFFVELPINYN